ncbi:MAG: MBL fold metallo-hydrolase [Theionarchaea archaeon]|nr:MBL fold metallo-hydrolase [Theionarchaea archaeon]
MPQLLFSKAGIATQILLDSILIDVGDGTLRDLLAESCDLCSIDIIAITHGHYDHVGGLFSVLGYMRMLGRESPLKILHPGSSEVEAIISGFTGVYSGSLPFSIDLIPVRDHDIFSFHAGTIQSIFVVHAGSTAQGIMPPIPATGYRITTGGKTYAVTGDSTMCDALKELVSGVDLAFIEATWTPERKAILTEKYGDIEESMLSVHLSQEQAHTLGALAKEYILIHT